MLQVCPGLKCENLVKILTSLKRLLTYLENDSIFKYNIQAPRLVLMTSLNLPVLYALVVCHYLYFFVYSRKVNDSNDSVNIITDENNSSSRDIETPNMLSSMDMNNQALWNYQQMMKYILPDQMKCILLILRK